MRAEIALAGVLLGCLAFGQRNPDSFGESIADELRSATGADIALFPGGSLVGNSPSNLSADVQYPADKVSLLPLTGKQVKLALERGVSLLPTVSPAFLYVSGITFTFSTKAAADNRIVAVDVAGSALDPAKIYKVAMPRNMANGGFGFFTVWKRDPKTDIASDITLESILKGKTVRSIEPRGRTID